MYAEYADGLAYPLIDRGTQVDSLRLPDGSGTVAVARRAGRWGPWTSLVALRGRLSTVAVPSGRVAAGSADPQHSRVDGDARGTRGLPCSRTPSSRTGAGARPIRFRTLFRSGQSVSVRVGSCLQWHGYTGHELYLFRRNGYDVGKVTFSGLPPA